MSDMTLERVIRVNDATWRLETEYLGQKVEFTLAHDQMAGLVEHDLESEGQAVDALREHKDDLDAAVRAVVGADGTPPAKFSTLAVDTGA